MTFREGHVQADGFEIRYLESGEGAPLVHLPGADGGHPTRAHELLARQRRVIVFEMPGSGQSWEDIRTTSMAQLASTMAQAVKNLGIEDFDLRGTSLGARTALGLALQAPDRVRALVLEAPAAPSEGADLEARLATLPAPALVLLGTRDGIVPPGTGGVYKALMPKAYLVFVYDAGHAVADDRPEAFADVVGDFLERHEAFVISRTATVIHP